MTQQFIYMKRALAAAIIATVLVATSYIFLEPQLVRAVTDNVTVTLTVDNAITISAAADMTMSPNLGLAVATSTASTTWTVVTNDPDGYTLEVRATGTPALVGGANSIADYTELASGTPESWDIPTGSSTAEFGFSAFGTDVSTGTWGTDGVCEDPTNLVSAERKYVGFKGTQDIQIATRSSTTSPSGVASTICVAVEQAGAYSVPSGVYTGEIVATALVQ